MVYFVALGAFFLGVASIGWLIRAHIVDYDRIHNRFILGPWYPEHPAHVSYLYDCQRREAQEKTK